jgi:hypothetical protein
MDRKRSIETVFYLLDIDFDTNIVEFERLDSEIYVDDNWISDSFTTVV